MEYEHFGFSFEHILKYCKKSKESKAKKIDYLNWVLKEFKISFFYRGFKNSIMDEKKLI